MSEHYLGNPNLKKAGVKVNYTEDQIIEYHKCAKDPEYFGGTRVTFMVLSKIMQELADNASSYSSEEQARNKTILFRGGSDEMEAYTKSKTK